MTPLGEAYLEQLKQIGIVSNDLLLVHSRMGGAPLDEIIGCFEALKESVALGAVAFPLFNFDFCKGTPYDYRRTPSQMGFLTELARRDRNVVRIYHPIYGFALIGWGAHHFAKIHNISSFGDDSFFGELRRRNGKILIINLSYQLSMTFFHHVEEMDGCQYRYMKEFTGNVIDAKGVVSERTYTMNVRNMEMGVVTNVDPMGERLEKEGLVKRGKLGRWDIRLLEAGKVFEATKDIPHTHPELLREIRL